MKSAAGVNYTYDGDDRRVQKSTGKLYWYGMGSDPLAESDATGNITDEYIFFGGKRLARRNISSGNVFYYFADHLGTSRVVTNSTGTLLDDSDFYPIGGEGVVLSSSGNTYKFTCKERSLETGADYLPRPHRTTPFGAVESGRMRPLRFISLRKALLRPFDTPIACKKDVVLTCRQSHFRICRFNRVETFYPAPFGTDGSSFQMYPPVGHDYFLG